MKKHKMINGKLLNLDKNFSDLSQKQQTFIIELMYEKYQNLHINGLYGKALDTELLSQIYEIIKNRQIWLPFGELKRKYYSKKMRIRKKILGQ